MILSRVFGLERLEQLETRQQLLGVVQQAALKGLERIAADAAARAPVRRGKLRGSIRAVAGGARRSDAIAKIIGAPYAHLVDEGHFQVARGPGRKGKSRGQLGKLRTALKRRRSFSGGDRTQAFPFITPAIANGEAELVRDVEAAIRAALR